MDSFLNKNLYLKIYIKFSSLQTTSKKRCYNDALNVLKSFQRPYNVVLTSCTSWVISHLISCTDCSGNVNKCERGVTISLLIRLHNNHQTESIIRAAYTDDPGYESWSLVRKSQDTLSFTIRWDGQASSVEMKFKSEVWYQYTFVMSSKGDFQLYINGRRIQAEITRKVAVKKRQSDVAASADIILGAKDTKINVNYDDIRLWHQALGDAEIALNYEKILCKALK